jgi:hypothetical protein
VPVTGLEAYKVQRLRILKILLMLINTPALASEDISCEKKVVDSHIVHCKAKKVIDVSLVSINGGECNAPAFHWHGSGGFAIPGTKECHYVGAVTLSIDGHNKTFAPL